MKKLLALLVMSLPMWTLAQKRDKAFTHTVTLETTQENLWKTLTDYASFKAWDNQVVDVSCKGELKKGSSCKLITGDGNIFDVEITDIVENHSYTLRYKLSSGNIYIKRSIEGEGNPKLTETVWYKGISKKTFEKYKGTDYQEVQKNRMMALKKYVEKRRT